MSFLKKLVKGVGKGFKAVGSFTQKVVKPLAAKLGTGLQASGLPGSKWLGGAINLASEIIPGKKAKATASVGAAAAVGGSAQSAAFSSNTYASAGVSPSVAQSLSFEDVITEKADTIINPPWYKKVPVWAWFVAVLVTLFGLVFLVFKRK